MLTYSIDFEDRLINESTRAAIYMQRPAASDPLHGTIYVKSDDPDAGKSHENLRFAGEDLGHYVPIIATVETLPYSHKNITVNVHRKQFLLKFAFAIKLHNSQDTFNI